MNKPIYALLILSALLLGIVNSSAQIKNFTPGDPDKFIKELSEFMSASKKKEGKDQVEKDFAPVFLSDTYSPMQRVKVVELANLMLKEKYRAYPHFEGMIMAFTNFPKSGKSEAFFNEWNIFILKVIDDKKAEKYLDDILRESASLFENNTFYKSSAVEWRSQSNNWVFKFDSIPLIEFPELDLLCLAKGDSSVIRGTKGVFFPTLEKWKGEGGRVTWERAGFDAAKTYAEFGKYDIRTKGSSFVIDSVVFYNEFFTEPLIGTLTEKVQAGKDEETASYPRFESYNKRLQIKNIFKSVDYDGGFTMAGNRLAGSGTEEEPAVLTFYHDNKPFLVSKSLDFTIRPEKITSQHSSIVFFIEKDSIYHADVELKFDETTRSLSLMRSEEGVSKSPFYNTYHNIDMYFGALYWKIDDPLMEMGSLMGSSEVNATFESIDYYKKQRYDAMIGFSFTHPLVQIRDFTKQQGYEAFFAKELAFYLKMGEEQTHLLLIDLNNKGFVSYDIETRWCELKPKTHNYLAASAGKRDYDVLQFNSDERKGKNGQLNLLNYNLLLRGVERINLSDSQKVTILPANAEVILKKNCDFRCGGRIYAGNFEFLGQEYYFNYDEFKIDLIKVDSCRIYVEDKEGSTDMKGNKDMVMVKNSLEGITGNIKIDAPTNKSGVHTDEYPQYPIFNSDKPSFVYYDKRQIQKGVYKRDDFYYTVEPFTIDSLDNFSEKDLKFYGTLKSAGIFPEIEEPLVLMEDYSLGFLRKESGGLPMYGGKSRFKNDITLDYNGLQGNGDLEYLSSVSASELFIFFPDSTKGRTNSFVNTEQSGKVEFPKAKAEIVDIAFYPKKDLLKASSVGKPIDFFEQEADLTGTLALQPQGMSGKGKMKFVGAELESLNFNYKRRKILADTSDFRINRTESEGLAFKTNNVSSDVDFDQRIGLFKSNDKETKLEFPENQYICFMDQFKWFMDKSEVEMSSQRQATDDFVIDTNEEGSRSNFFSTNEFQDSLNFLAPNAVFDIKKSMITANKIKYIAVADSKITPKEGTVVIQKYAKMETLQDAIILSNYVTQYHRIFNSTIDIKGRLKYEGSGDYTYIDENKKEQIIHLNKLSIDTTLQTVGQGMIKEDDKFFLSPFFEYYGEFDLSANEKFLTFKGGTRLLHTCDALERNWLKFEALIDPTDIYIPIDTGMTDTRAAKLGAGVVLSDDSPYKVYASFLSRKADRKDQPLLLSTGYLFYDKPSKNYLIGDKDKIKNANLPGQLLRLNTESCAITGNGRVDLHANLGLVKLAPMGDVDNKGAATAMEMKGVMTMDFMLDDNAWKRMAEQLSAWPDLAGIDIAKTKYEQSIVELLGFEKSDKLISELNLNGQLKKIPDELQHTFYLGDVTLRWNESDQSFQSEGPIGIAHMDKRQIFRYVKGKIEIERKRSFDVLTIYFELDPANWYFFEYKNEVMTVSSSDKEFIATLQEVKDDNRRIKENNMNYSFIVSNTPKKRSDFIDRFPEFR